MKKLKEILEEIINEILDEQCNCPEGECTCAECDCNEEEEIDELNSTATTGDMGYMTPGAFKKGDGKDTEEEGGCPEPEVLGYKKLKVPHKNTVKVHEDLLKTIMKEVTYRQYRYDDSMTPKQKINKAIGNINSQLIKVERVVNQNIKLKQEMGVDNSQYWKLTKSKLQKVSERMMRISGKLRKLWV